MKKKLCLIGCIAICLFFLAEYSNNNIISSIGTGSTLFKIISSQSVDTADWKPTPYKTVNNFNGVNMTVKKGTVSSRKLTIILKNNSHSQCIYGEDFYLEKKINGKWYQIPVTIKGNYAFDSIGYNLNSGSESEIIVDWSWLYESLDAGEFRIVKSIMINIR